MADPISWVMVGGAAISAAGAYSQGQAGKAAAGYNTRLRERDAITALSQANQDAIQFSQRAQQAHGTLLAGYGASGVSTNEGSPMDALRMSAANAKYDEGAILYKGRLKATGYYDDAQLNRMAGRTAEEQGYMNSASSLLVGAGRSMSTRASMDAGRPSSSKAYDEAVSAQNEARRKYGIA